MWGSSTVPHVKTSFIVQRKQRVPSYYFQQPTPPDRHSIIPRRALSFSRPINQRLCHIASPPPPSADFAPAALSLSDDLFPRTPHHIRCERLTQGTSPGRSQTLSVCDARAFTH